jgi:DNA-binding transcriptional LysR family regulator
MTDLQVKCFLTLAKTMNFTKAAELLSISQPTLSKQISALEKNIGVLLFKRSLRDVSLTPGGKVMYDAMEYSFLQISQGIERARNIQRGHEGVLRIGYLQGWNLDAFLQDILISFREQYPKINLRINRWNTSKLLAGLDRNELDVFFSQSNVADIREDLHHEMIYHTNALVACSQNYNLLKSFEAQDYTSDTFILVASEADPIAQSYLDAFCAYMKFSCKHAQLVDSAEAQLLAVKYGMGIALLGPLSRICNAPEYCFNIVEGFSYDVGMFAKKTRTTITRCKFLRNMPCALWVN